MERPTSDYSREHWVARLTDFVPEFLSGHAVLADHVDDSSVFFHGSMAEGFGDEFADLDLWLLLSDASIAEIDRVSETRFFEFECDGVMGHVNAESVAEFAERVERCDMDVIHQLRHGEVVFDRTGAAPSLVATARAPMRPEVREALVFYHYVEVRSEDRSFANPISRGDAVAILLALPKMIAHSYRTALLLAWEPYPYDKWLERAARRTEVGARVGEEVDAILDVIEDGGLRWRMPRRDHPFDKRGRIIQSILRDAARESGIDGDWLDHWWLYMTQARDSYRTVRWSGEAL